MAKIRNLLKDFKVETAVSSRKCHASSKHRIAKGEDHLAIYHGMERQNICRACFAKMVPIAQNHWNRVVAELQ